MVANIWDRYAESYDRLAPHTSFCKELLQKTVRNLENCNIILDVGVGTGILAAALAKRGKQVHGIDNNFHMLSEAKKKISSKWNGTLFLSLQNAENLDFSDGKFDGVASINILYYVNNPHAVLKEVHRVLKPGGIFVVSGPKQGADLSVLYEHAMLDWGKLPRSKQLETDMDVVIRCNKELAREGLFNVYTTQQLTTLLNDIGFTEILYSDDSTYLGQSYFLVAKK